jgi:hypothetical protein
MTYSLATRVLQTDEGGNENANVIVLDIGSSGRTAWKSARTGLGSVSGQHNADDCRTDGLRDSRDIHRAYR